MGVEKEIKNSINKKFIVLCFCQKNIRKEFVFMQNNFTTFRPEIKGVKIKKVELICDTYHVYGIRVWYKSYPDRYFKGQEIINHKGIPSMS